MPPDRVQCVLVIYKVALQASQSLHTLSAALRAHPLLAKRTSLLVYDNSPEPQPCDLPEDLCADVQYWHDAHNGGLAAAYNQALEMAERAGCAWLWLFDQDTTVLSSLLPSTFAAIDAPAPPELSAIVPRLVQGSILLSPVSVERLRYKRIPEQVAGIQSGWLTALNSCACVRVDALRSIGGFPRQYWLDFLDHAVFHRLHEQGGRVFVLDVTIPHRLSTNNLMEESSPARYRNVLDAEWLFVRETGWGGGTLLHRLRLLKRAMRTLVSLREPAFAWQVLRASLR